jgi:hypothetical protein
MDARNFPIEERVQIKDAAQSRNLAGLISLCQDNNVLKRDDGGHFAINTELRLRTYIFRIPEFYVHVVKMQSLRDTLATTARSGFG